MPQPQSCDATGNPLANVDEKPLSNEPLENGTDSLYDGIVPSLYDCIGIALYALSSTTELLEDIGNVSTDESDSTISMPGTCVSIPDSESDFISLPLALSLLLALPSSSLSTENPFVSSCFSAGASGDSSGTSKFAFASVASF